MTGEVIKSFMVGLGFGVDDSSLSKFNKALESATVKVLALYSATNLMAAGIVKGITSISESFEEMGYEYRIIAPAINKALVLRNELLKAYSAAGINIQKVIVASVKLNMSIAKTKFAFQALYQSTASRFFGLLTKQSDIFRQKIYQNMPAIQQGLERFIYFVFKALEVVTALGSRVWSILTLIYDFFVKLDKATDGWSTIILGVVAAWKYLNLSFLLTPFGMLLAGFVALIALWDDFKTFREGGQSLIDWGSDVTKTFVGIGAAILAVVAAFYAWGVATKVVTAAMAAFEVVMAAVRTVMIAFNVVALLNPLGAIIAAVVALIALITVLIVKWDVIKAGLSNFFSGIGQRVLDFAGGGGPAVPPVSGAVQNSQVNQNVNHQTNINVVGSPDAHATGAAVIGQQTRAQRDSIDYLNGSTR